MTYAEDASQVRTRNGPQVMATLPVVQSTGRVAIGLIRQAGYNKIAATIRRIKYDTALLIAVLGLKNPS